jgi:hypothetical protein
MWTWPVDQSQQVYDLFVVLKKVVHFSGYNAWGKAGRLLPTVFASPTHLTPPERHVFSSTENHAMREPSKFEVKFLGLSVSAEGALGIGAALLVVFGAFMFYRF